jgi:hypothetical protein
MPDDRNVSEGIVSLDISLPLMCQAILLRRSALSFERREAYDRG